MRVFLHMWLQNTNKAYIVLASTECWRNTTTIDISLWCAESFGIHLTILLTVNNSFGATIHLDRYVSFHVGAVTIA